jgi:hypothetical protein
MNLTDEALRAIIRGAGFRATRALPVWVSLVILGLALIWGAK